MFPKDFKFGAASSAYQVVLSPPRHALLGDHELGHPLGSEHKAKVEEVAAKKEGDGEPTRGWKEHNEDCQTMSKKIDILIADCRLMHRKVDQIATRLDIALYHPMSKKIDTLMADCRLVHRKVDQIATRLDIALYHPIGKKIDSLMADCRLVSRKMDQIATRLDIALYHPEME